MYNKSMRLLTPLLLSCLFFGCDPIVNIKYVVENRCIESFGIVKKNIKQTYDTLNLAPAGELMVSADDAIMNDVRTFFNDLGDSTHTAIVTIKKGDLTCKKNWTVKSNWIYKEFDEKSAELRFIVYDADY